MASDRNQRTTGESPGIESLRPTFSILLTVYFRTLSVTVSAACHRLRKRIGGRTRSRPRAKRERRKGGSDSSNKATIFHRSSPANLFPPS